MQLHLAQLNVATLRQPIDHPDTAGFADGLAPVNALGESSPGFVWRLQDDAGDATSIRMFDNPLTIPNLTVWEDLAALRDFVYRGLHRDFFRKRSEWFEDGSLTAMWWVPADSTPTVEDAKARLRFLERFGPSSFAFQMGQQFPPLVVVRRDLDHPDVAPMIEQLNGELIDTEPEGGKCFHSLSPEEVQNGGAFFIAYLDGAPLACGAYRRPTPRGAGPGVGRSGEPSAASPSQPSTVRDANRVGVRQLSRRCNAWQRPSSRGLTDAYVHSAEIGSAVKRSSPMRSGALPAYKTKP